MHARGILLLSLRQPFEQWLRGKISIKLIQVFDHCLGFGHSLLLALPLQQFRIAL